MTNYMHNFILLLLMTAVITGMMSLVTVDQGQVKQGIIDTVGQDYTREL